MKQTETAELIHRKLIAEGFPVGARIPSVRELAVQYRISSGTVYRGLKQLVEKDFLYSIPQSGLFVKNILSPISLIGYAGNLPCAQNANVLLNESIKNLFQYFSQKDCEPQIINYHDLMNPKIAMQKLSAVRGLFLHRDFVDNTTRPVLQQYNGKIVMAGNTAYYEQLPCSQIIPDFVPALKEFALQCDLTQYKEILILHGKYPNGLTMKKIINTFLLDHGIAEKKISSLPLSVSSQTAALAAYHRFANNNELADTLIISLSFFLSVGLYQAFSTLKNPPDTLNIDGPDAYLPHDLIPENYFTSIYWNLPQIYVDAAELLIQLVEKNDSRQHIIKVPTKLSIQKSIKKLTGELKNEKKK